MYVLFDLRLFTCIVLYSCINQSGESAKVFFFSSNFNHTEYVADLVNEIQKLKCLLLMLLLFSG